MDHKEKGAYILGTDRDELYRLGLQHQVWASEAQKGWKLAGFTAGQRILDLGSGPGFCSKELGFIVGQTGAVVAVDRSEKYIKYLDKLNEIHGLNIESRIGDFDDLEFEPSSFDGMYCRWALAWVPNPKEILSKVIKALKPGAKIVLHEYYDWATHSTYPPMPSHSHAISQCLKSFKDQPGDIDIGRELSSILLELGMEIVNTRPMAKMSNPKEITWQWPKSFYETYFPRLVDAGYLTEDEKDKAINEFTELESIPGASLFCPTLIEVIAQKV